jgi:TatD DNase family protein
VSDGQPPLVDTHCHLILPAFEGEIDIVIQRAAAQGVRRVLVPGIDLATSQAAVALAQAHPGIYAAVGIHPHSTSGWSGEQLPSLSQLARQPGVAAIGEIGLDYYRHFSSAADQRAALKDQLQLARSLDLPVVLHSREAGAELLDILEDCTAGPSRDSRRSPGVLHAFSGDNQLAARALSAGFYLGIGGPITFSNSGPLRQIVAGLPLDRLLLETDAPYLSPHPWRGQRNEPALVHLVAQGLASVLGLSYDDIARRTTENAEVLFGWSHESDDSNLL